MLCYHDELWSFDTNEIVKRWDLSPNFAAWGVSQNPSEPAVMMAHTLVEVNGDLYITCKKVTYSTFSEFQANIRGISANSPPF